jgi:hypothetical protein
MSKMSALKVMLFALPVIFFGCVNDQKAIFNGNDLTGWEKSGPAKWYVEDGMLIGEGVSGADNGYLTTTNKFDNFEVALEFRFDKKGDFGVFFHTEITGSDPFGWKVVVAPLNGGTGSIYEQSGRGWLERIPEQKEKILKENGWNKLKIKVENGHVTTWLNGYLMVDYTDSKIDKGSGGIAFQIPSDSNVKIKLRNIRVKTLDELEKVNQYI